MYEQERSGLRDPGQPLDDRVKHAESQTLLFRCVLLPVCEVSIYLKISSMFCHCFDTVYKLSLPHQYLCVKASEGS